MRKCFFFIRNLDYLSNEVKLTIQRTNNSRLKTIIGGIISITNIIILVAICLFFFIKLLQKGSIFVTVSTESTSFNNLTESNNFPFLIRLTDKLNQPIEQSEKVYNVHLKYWYGGNNETQELVEQKNLDVEVEQCSLNKHFGKYEHLFKNITDLNTFYCPKLRPYNETIYGRYGDLNPFGYYHFYITMCVDKESCLPLPEIKKITMNAYLDFRTVNHDINNSNSKAKVESIYSDRHMISNTVYKRIWFYFNEIKYLTDDGLFFTSNLIDSFASYESMKYDIDYRDIFQGTYPGTFVTMTILSTGKVSIYNRRYLKLQDYLASVGGIINFVQICAYVLNYIYAQNTYYMKLINDLNIIQTINNTNTTNKENANKSTFRIMKKKLTELTNEVKNDYVDNNKLSIIDKEVDKRNMVMINKMQKMWYKLFPISFFAKSDTVILNKSIENVKELMNVSAILTKLENHHNFVKEFVRGDKVYMNYPNNKLKSNHYCSNHYLINTNNKRSCKLNNFLEKSNQKLIQ